MKAHEEVFSTEMLIHSLRANAAEESDEEAAGIQIILADRLADLTAALSDRDQRLAALEAELKAEGARSKRWIEAGLETDRMFVAEREAHAKTKAGLRELVEESGGDNLPCVACGFGHSANCDKGYETELIERADRAEAIVRGLREWQTQAFRGELLANDKAFIEGDLTVVRVRRGRANLLEDVLAKLDELEGR